MDKISFLEKKLIERYESLIKELATQKDFWFKSFWDDTNVIKSEIKGLRESIEHRREEFIAETKRKLEHLNEQIFRFKEDYLSDES
ncbi:MAG: hypothetical protein N3A69_18360, partial [Leptospiraceae bacterium]|nr:hypothetical protein [Leptospiraceae bacterium]